MHLAKLRARHLIIKHQMFLFLTTETDALREVAIISHKAQRALVQHLLAVIRHFIHRFSTFYIYIHFQFTIRT